MTPQEGNYCYKRAVKMYNEASSHKKSSETKLNNCTKSKQNMESQRYELEQDVRQLRERVSDLEDVISVLINDVDEQIIRTNEIARTAGDNYKAAIWCNDITQASIEVAYRENSVTIDTNSCSAMDDCKIEIRRVEEEIVCLEEEAKKLSQKIAILSKDIKTAQTAIATYKREMKKWENEKWEYYKYRHI